ncbi:hypothetical protein TYRP_015459 [Tyrophagus putrescentiae]|nr:hypothetical protein TYRP_015459 [Tyrophagus putrescentiae]
MRILSAPPVSKSNSGRPESNQRTSTDGGLSHYPPAFLFNRGTKAAAYQLLYSSKRSRPQNQELDFDRALLAVVNVNPKLFSQSIAGELREEGSCPGYTAE